MALINNTFSATQNTNFGVRTPVQFLAPNRSAPLVTGRIIKQDMGPVGTAIPAGAVLGNTIVVSPTGALQTYTLPTASSILLEYGRNINTGIANLSVGDIIPLHIINRGTSPAFIVSNPSGSDNTAAIIYAGGVTGAAGPNFTGSVVPIGHGTNVFLEWLQVSSSVNGSTGQYSIYI